MARIVKVAVPRPLENLFSYLVPDELLLNLGNPLVPGAWVEIPFGRTKTHGFVIEVLDEKDLDIDPKKLKPILAVGGNGEVVLPSDVMQVCKFASDYYIAPLGEVIATAVPAATLGLRSATQKSRKVKKVSEDVKLHTFTEHQAKAFKQIEDYLALDEAKKPILIEGVTGSGKTELYLQLAYDVLKTGKSVLILAPEIALTPQLHERVELGLGQTVALWHSSLPAGKRRDLGAAMRQGEIKVVVGARSSVFAPLQNLGLIIVDEEHDSTYKQEDRFRYNARDLAIYRANKLQIPCLLGSATPSFESLERVTEGRYHKVMLTQKAKSSTPIELQIVNLSEEPTIEGARTVITETTLNEIQAVLDRGQQAMIFLNRRGFAAFLVCRDCGHKWMCPNCSVAYVFHRTKSSPIGYLKCHQCGDQTNAPSACPACESKELDSVGMGTECVEDELAQLLKDAKILRLDRDQITSATRLNEILRAFRDQEANLLVGTQMLVKGHDFPNVALVVILMADSLFSWPDFRAQEKALQTLVQVAGRAGRSHVKGKVLIQTFQPDHELFKVMMGEKTKTEWVAHERKLRQDFGYPPFMKLAKLRLEHKNKPELEQAAKKIFQTMKTFGSNQVEMIGPYEPVIERLKGDYRLDILLKSHKYTELRDLIVKTKSFVQANKWNILIDIDPMGN